MMKIRNVCSYGIVFLLLFSGCGALCAEKPTVAIKTAMVAESVSKAARKNLNLDKLLAEMEASFLATRKFNVITRKKSTLEAIRQEQRFAKSDLAAGDTARTGELKNVDYLIIPEIQIFAFYSRINKIPNLQSKYFRRDFGTLEINAQVVDTSSGQIMTTFFLKDNFSTKERMVNSSSGVPNKKYFTRMAKSVSAQMADQFLALVFPVEIISVKGESVYLNRGQDGGFKKGDILNVYIKGEALIDPYTGEQLGSAEEYAGQVKVVRVNPKFTIASIVKDKQEGDISVGCIVRKP